MKKKKNFMEMLLIGIIAVGLTLVIGILFGALIAYEVSTLFGTALDTSILIGAVAGLIGGVGVGFHFVEDFA